MPLTSDERDQVRANRFHLDLLEMVLTRRGNPADVYRGSGFISQSADGMIEYRIYDRVRQSSFKMLALSVGELIPDEEFYDLEAQDLRGRTWRAYRTLPGEDSSTSSEGCVCRGTFWKIVCTETVWEPVPEDRMWMYLPGEFKIPTSGGTRVVRETPDDRSYSFDLNLWKIQKEGFDLLLTKVDGGVEIDASIAEGSFPEHFDMRLEESLWFTLAVPAKWILLEEVKGSERHFTVRAIRDGSTHARLRPPLEPEHGLPAEYLGEMLIRYLQYILPYSKPRYHPISLALYRNLRASAISLNAEALWLPVSIETVVRQCFKHLGRPDQTFLKSLDEAIKYMGDWTGETSLKERIVKFLSGWRGQNPREALNQLVRSGVITQQQLAAWNMMRQRMAHGQEINRPFEELPMLRNLTYMALLRLLFEAIGYSGLYTDRSVRGWPRVEYQVKHC